jgi:hypothetical protein
MFSAKVLLTVAAALQGAMAVPVTEESSVAKRGEGIHFMNCTPLQPTLGDGTLTKFSIIMASSGR